MAGLIKKFAIALGCSSLALLFVGMGNVSTSRGEQAGTLHVESSKRSFGEAPVGAKPVVVFRLGNRTGHPIKILGSNAGCYRAACLVPMGLPLLVPVGESRDLEIEVDCYNPGDLSKTVTFFTDNRDQRKIALSVEGRVVESPTR